MKILAMYLPQYHEIKENNEWWGQGYTEWTAVRQAKPLFNRHNQPRVPLNNNYYDLSEPEVNGCLGIYNTYISTYIFPCLLDLSYEYFK